MVLIELCVGFGRCLTAFDVTLVRNAHIFVLINISLNICSLISSFFLYWNSFLCSLYLFMALVSKEGSPLGFYGWVLVLNIVNELDSQKYLKNLHLILKPTFRFSVFESTLFWFKEMTFSYTQYQFFFSSSIR